MHKKIIIGVLNDLIDLNNSRIEGYASASNATGEADLKLLFTQFQQTSHQCKKELVIEIHKLGGTTFGSTIMYKEFFTIWEELKAAIKAKNNRVIFDACEDAEDVTVKIYSEALRKNLRILTAEQHALLHWQQSMISVDFEKVKDLRDMILEHQHHLAQ